MAVDYEIRPHGDSALLVVFGERIDPLISRRVHAAAAVVRQARDGGEAWSTPVAAYASLLVGYDALTVDFDAARRQLVRTAIIQSGEHGYFWRQTCGRFGNAGNIARASCQYDRPALPRALVGNHQVIVA